MGRGPIPAKIMLIGERPGEEEAYAHDPRPFIGMAGKYLDLMLANAGLSRDDIYITNLVKTFSEYGKPTPEEIARDAGILTEEILAVQPSIVGLLGTFATESVLGREKANLERTHGIPVSANGRSDNHAGNGTHFSNGVYIPMYHPGSVIYDINSMSFVQQDFNRLKQLYDEYVYSGKVEVGIDKWKGREYYSVQPKGTTDTFSEGLDCAIDTEGNSRVPWCATISPGYGISFLVYPGTPMEIRSDVVWLHNSLYDLGVLRSLGVHLGDSQFRDTMVYAYLLCLEPQGLKELAWRKCGMEMMSYKEVIGVADENRAVEYLVGAGAVEWKEAEPYVAIEGGKAKVKRPQSVNQRIHAILRDYDKWKKGEREKAVDPRERWGNVDDWVKQEVVETLGEMPEATLDDVPRAKAEWYACRDADATRRIAPILESQISAMGLQRISEIDHSIIPMVDRMQTVGWKLAGREFWDELGGRCERLMHQAKLKVYELTGWEINPDSGDQCAEMLYGKVGDGGLGIDPPAFTDGGKNKESRGKTNDKTLEAIAHLHPVVDAIFDYREPSKVRSSFVAPLSKACGEGDGRYRYSLRITRVASGRLAGVGKPNLLAIPVRTDLGKEVRGGFIAPDGRVIYDIDLNQIEMREMADQSRDEGMCRIFVDGKLDVHTDNAALMFGKKYGEIDPDGAERYAAKRVGFGIITQITEIGLLAQMTLARAKRPDGQAWTEDDCKQLIKGFYEARPAVRRMLDDAAEECRRTGMVRSRAGRIRYLPGIWSLKKYERAEAARQAGSHKISASAQEIMKVAMADFWARVMRKIYQWEQKLWVEPLIQVHDELVLEVPDTPMMKSLVNDEATWSMTKTSTYPSGVPIKAKGKFGINWSAAK